jgi:hypothetical protein
MFGNGLSLKRKPIKEWIILGCNNTSVQCSRGFLQARKGWQVNTKGTPVAFDQGLCMLYGTKGHMVLHIVLIRRSRDSERTSASTNGLRPRCIAGPKYLRKLEDWSNVGKTWSKDQSRSRRCGSRRSEDTGLEVRDVGESGKDLDKRRTRMSSLH